MDNNFLGDIEAARERMVQQEATEASEVQKREIWERERCRIAGIRDQDGGVPIDSIPAFSERTKDALDGFVRSLDKAMVAPEKITIEWRRGVASGLLRLAGVDQWRDRDVYGWLFAVGKIGIGNSNGAWYDFCAVTPEMTTVPTMLREPEDFYNPGTVINQSFRNEWYVESYKKHGSESRSMVDAPLYGFNPALFGMTHPERNTITTESVENPLIQRQVAESIAHLGIEWVQ